MAVGRQVEAGSGGDCKRFGFHSERDGGGVTIATVSERDGGRVSIATALGCWMHSGDGGGARWQAGQPSLGYHVGPAE